MTSRAASVLVALALLVIALFVCSLAIGSTWIPIDRVIHAVMDASGSNDGSAIVLRAIRLPRACTAVLAGAALGVAGLQMQTLFRNPLADPFALGISAGATLGVALVVLGASYGTAAAFGADLGLASDAVMIGASIAGAAAVLSLVLVLSVRLVSPTTVLIVGLMFGYATSAAVTVLVAVAQPERLAQWVQWGFGSFSGVTWSRLRLFAPLTIVGVGVAMASTKQLNVLLLGENYARSMGLPIRKVRLATMFSASMLGAVVTAFCGPIYFLGMAVPHLCRGLLRTSDHRPLVPAAAMMGAAVALAAQLLALVVSRSGLLPLNAVTSLLGAPVVVAVLLRNRRGAWTS
jgi:iron complex transport system permease protein